MFSRRVPSLTVDEIDLRTAFRTQRRTFLLRHPEKKFEAYIHESCLVTRFGGTEVLRRQLQRLVEDSHRSNITIRIIPFKAHTYPGVTESFIYSYGEVAELDTVETDSSRGPEFYNAPNELKGYRAILDRIEKASLGEEESREMITATCRELKD
ncbi:hypothetical protein GCM10009639_13260 [Kitasatospora putterlickiae]|uniref:DUF5753 domain-containing protein n=2 Tax=Kitasatospora putterlickiae TaxID=221725 RepID=A0ABN1XQR9_9ACTN